MTFLSLSIFFFFVRFVSFFRHKKTLSTPSLSLQNQNENRKKRTAQSVYAQKEFKGGGKRGK